MRCRDREPEYRVVGLTCRRRRGLDVVKESRGKARNFCTCREIVKSGGKSQNVTPSRKGQKLSPQGTRPPWWLWGLSILPSPRPSVKESLVLLIMTLTPTLSVLMVNHRLRTDGLSGFYFNFPSIKVIRPHVCVYVCLCVSTKMDFRTFYRHANPFPELLQIL